MKSLFRFLRTPWLLALLGLVALSLLIWFVGPLIAIAEYVPLGPTLHRWWLIGLIFAIWVVRRLWAFGTRMRLDKQFMANIVRKPAGDKSEPTASALEVAELKGRLEEALDALKKTRVKGRFGRQYVYELPWYVIIGAPGAGKTTALLNSGLDFPLSERFGASAIRGIGGTRNCDWWFTNDAVLLDTAGRYTTQDSDRAADKEAWEGFLGLLKKYRRRRPINGVLLAISLSEIMRQSPGERAQHAQQLRVRIQELHEKLGIRFPLYVLFTKCDLLAGFNEFFADLSADERAQVWGTTFALREDQAATDLSSFGERLGALEQRLNERVLARVQQERDPIRRAAIYAFPQQFAATKELIAGFIASVFEANRFHDQPMLRGVYFTSGTQEGTPIDRVMSSLGRMAGLAHSPVPVKPGAGKSFFLKRLLHDLVFKEAGLASANVALERRMEWLRAAALAGIVGLCVLLLLGWFVSYGRNKTYIAQVNESVTQVKSQFQAFSPEAGIEALLPVLDAVRRLPAGYDSREDHVPWSMRLGLYQGDKLGSEAQAAYLRMLHTVLLPTVERRLEQQLRSGSGEFDYQFETLKVYLMLSDRSRFDLDTIRHYAEESWRRQARELSPDVRERLMKHTAALFEDDKSEFDFVADDALVADVRRSLLSVPRERRLYDRLKRDPEVVRMKPFLVTDAAGAQAQMVLMFKSGRSLSDGIPGLFTNDGYHLVFKKKVGELAALELKESWVLGQSMASEAAELPKLQKAITRLYLDEYVTHWQRLLSDISVTGLGDVDRAASVLNILASPDSPLRRLLIAAAKETTLTKPAKPDLLAKGASKLENILGDKLPGTSGPGDEAAVDKHFEPLHSMTQGEGKLPIDNALALMNDAYVYVQAMKESIQKGQPVPIGGGDVLSRLKVEGPRYPAPVGGVLHQVAQESGRIGMYGNYRQFNEEWVSRVVPACRPGVIGRYPVAKSSSVDATREDFARLFAPGEAMEQFFEKVRPFVDVARNPWALRAVGQTQLPMSREALTAMQNAAIIRDVFFRGGGKQPVVNFELKPVTMDARITLFILDIDGQIVRYDHGPAVISSLRWPGTRGSDQVRVQVSPPAPGGRTGFSEEGPWALFKMFDRARIEPTSSQNVFRLTFDLEGRTATFELRASSVYNPFRLSALERFACPDRL